MPVMRIVFNGDGILNDVHEEDIIHIMEPITAAALPGGMESGKPSVAFIVKLPDGKTVIAETSMELFLAAAKAFSARFEGEMKITVQ